MSVRGLFCDRQWRILTGYQSGHCHWGKQSGELHGGCHCDELGVEMRCDHAHARSVGHHLRVEDQVS